jgi:hypothetical protein
MQISRIFSNFVQNFDKMLIKTKKYELTPKMYRRVGMQYILRKQWWLPVAIFVGIIALNVIINALGYKNWWIYTLAPLGAWLWYLFWWIQYTGIPQLPQNQVMFEKYSYEISSQNILMKKTPQEAMMFKWDLIKEAHKSKDAITLVISKGQFLHFPFKMFNSDNEIKFLETILIRKNLLPSSDNEKNEGNKEKTTTVQVSGNGVLQKSKKSK